VNSPTTNLGLEQMKNSLVLSGLALVSLPIGALAVLTMANQVFEFFNPCTVWGASGGSVTVSSVGSCSGAMQMTSETPLAVLVRLGLIQGGILFALAVGTLGTSKHMPRLMVASAVILFVESVPLIFDGLFIWGFLPAGFFLWAARSKHPSEPFY